MARCGAAYDQDAAQWPTLSRFYTATATAAAATAAYIALGNIIN